MKLFNISYATNADLDALKASLTSLGTIQYSLENIRIIGVQVEDTITEIDFQQISGVVLAEQDFTTTVTSHFEWHQLRLVTNDLPLKTIYNPINYGDDVVVYLVDSGIDATHTELSESRIENLYSYDGTFNDTAGHGTAMASLINGKTIGVSKNCIVRNVKIPFGDVTASSLLMTFDAILANHMLDSSVKVVNCSWSVPKSQLLDNKITELQNSGLVVVAAAGNTGVDANSLSPVGLNTVIGVAASDVYDRVISWAPGSVSNYGFEVDIAAPGINVPIATLNNNYQISSGTSLSAAITSGVIAQYIKLNANYSAQQIQTLVLESAFEDVLFRNEIFYGTTPNRLLKAPFFTPHDIWDIPTGTVFPVKKGVVTEITLQSDKISFAEYTDVTLYQREISSPTEFLTVKLPWATGGFSGNTFTITTEPTNDVEVGKYAIYITSVDNNGNQYYSKFRLGVYENMENELDSIEIEKYLGMENNQTVLRVTPACETNEDCGKGFCCGGFCC